MGTPRPTFVKTKTPKPTKMKTTKVTSTKTPKPTVWKAPKTTKIKTTKTPKPTYVKTKTPKPTKEPKTPRPTATYLRTTSTYMRSPETTTTYIRATPTPTMRPTDPTTTGWGTPIPMTGCARQMRKKDCENAKKCSWKMGYPPMAFAEDSDYQLLSEENFFAVNGVVDAVSDMDSNMLMLCGVLFVAVLIFAMRQFSKKNKEVVVVSD